MTRLWNIVMTRILEHSDDKGDGALCPEKLKQMPNEVIARFYSMGISHSLKHWITHNVSYTSEQLCEAYDYMKTMSIIEIIDREHTKQ